MPLYFAKERHVLIRNGQILRLGSEDPLNPGEAFERHWCRFRTLGCVPCTGAVLSRATTLEEIIEELANSKFSEREHRAIDHDRDGSMEMKKRDGYF